MGPTDDSRHTCLRAVRLDRRSYSRWLPPVPRRCGRVGHPPKFSASIEGVIMQASLPEVYLARHGETAWTLTGQHTGRTDIPLTARGEHNAMSLRQRLNGVTFTKVFVSPLGRARRTCELAGFGDTGMIVADVQEWDYGDYEGRRTADIRHERPDWDLFRDGCPGGESVAAIGARADRGSARLRAVGGNVLLFSHGHLLRA